MYACSSKPGAVFSRGCALPMIARTFLLTHPLYLESRTVRGTCHHTPSPQTTTTKPNVSPIKLPAIAAITDLCVEA